MPRDKEKDENNLPIEGKILKPGELILRKPNILIRCFSEMQGVKREFFNHLLFKSQKYFAKDMIHSSTIMGLKESLGYKTNDYDFIKKHLLMMQEAKISWEKAGEEKYKKHHAGFLNVFEYLLIEDDIIKWKYTPTIREMASIYKEYTSIDLEVQKLFDSQYALAFFEYCMSYSVIGKTGEKKLEHFRALIGVEDKKYRQIKELNKKVIKKSVSSIKNKTGLNINIQTIRSRNSVKKINCHIQNPIRLTDHHLNILLKKIGGNNKSIKELRDRFSDDLIQDTLDKLQFPDTVKYKMSYLKKVLINKTTKNSQTTTISKQRELQTTDNQPKKLSPEEKQEFRLSHWKKLDNVQKLKHFEDAKKHNLPFLKHIEAKAMELADVLMKEFTSTIEFKWMFDVLFP